jgi:hypothetical protein
MMLPDVSYVGALWLLKLKSHRPVVQRVSGK